MKINVYKRFYAFILFALLITGALYAQNNCSNIPNPAFYNIPKNPGPGIVNHVFGGQSFGQSIFTDASCISGNAFSEFSFSAQGNSGATASLSIYEGVGNGGTLRYTQNGISFPAPNLGSILTVVLAGGSGDLSFNPNQFYTFIITINSGSLLIHLSPNEVEIDGEAYFNGVFYPEADMKFEFSQIQGCGDADNDGVCDDDDNCPSIANADQADNDSDGDGDACDTDDDNDGQSDADEVACGSDPLDAASMSPDNDGDNSPDCVDADDDNDGVVDADDAFPFDPSEWADNDNDGIGDNADTDDDNDGQSDADEAACGSDPLDAASMSPDNDGDSSPDCVDEDDDNDGILDNCDTAPFVNNFVYNGVGPDFPSQWLCSNNNKNVKVLICHNGNTICVSENAVNTHIGGHEDDYLGECSCGTENAVNPGASKNDAQLGTGEDSGLSGISALELAEKARMEVFPNPAGDQVNIQLHGLEGEASLVIFDHLGRTVLSRQLEQGKRSLQLDLDNGIFHNGIYLVSITVNGERMIKQLMIAK